MSAINLFMYSDYRVFLQEYYDTRKSGNPNFSFRYLSQQAGINSSAFFKYVMEGKRNLTKATILKTCIALKLKDKDAEYFENLVFFNQAKTIKEKNLYFDRLTKLRGKYETRKVKEEQFSFYGEWYHGVVRELLACSQFKGDFQGLSKKLNLPVAPKKLEESLKLLAHLGMAKKDAQGRWRASDPVLTTEGQVDSKIVIEFQKTMLQMAMQAFESEKAEDRLMSATTFGISEETFAFIKKKIREMKSELLELARLDPKPSRVYQMNINLFPLTKV